MDERLREQNAHMDAHVHVQLCTHMSHVPHTCLLWNHVEWKLTAALLSFFVQRLPINSELKSTQIRKAVRGTSAVQGSGEHHYLRRWKHMLSVFVRLYSLPKQNQTYSKYLSAPMPPDHSKELLVLETVGHIRYPWAALIEPCHDPVSIVLLLASFKCLCRFKHRTVVVVLAFHGNRVARLALPHFGNPT